MGTDYPFHIGVMKPVETVTAAATIGAVRQARIFGTNAAELLELSGG